MSAAAAPEPEPVRGATRRVAVVVPLGLQESLSRDEETSLRHLVHYLGRYDRIFVLPQRSRFEREGFTARRFDDRYFGSVAGYTRLLLSRRFYEAFADYEYILIYHLDALVLSDRLLEWCDAGYDFIGPPWLRSVDEPEQGFSRVGNGGFSLRRVAAFLKVLDSRRRGYTPRAYWNKYLAGRSLATRLRGAPRCLLKCIRPFNNVRHEAAGFDSNEDLFWSSRGPHYDPEFRIAPVDVALRFAFERAPRLGFRLTGGTLPFGCHAWPRYDREFWEPYLLA